MNRSQSNLIDNEYIYEVSMNIRTMAEMSGAKALMDSLEKEGVDIVFGLPGGANLPIYDALVDANFRHVLVRHEQSAAHMADGYARIKEESRSMFGYIRTWCNKFDYRYRDCVRRFFTTSCNNRTGATKHDWKGCFSRNRYHWCC